jgi:uncharacterized membrane protein
MDSIRVSEAPDSGSIPDEATKVVGCLLFVVGSFQIKTLPFNFSGLNAPVRVSTNRNKVVRADTNHGDRTVFLLIGFGVLAGMVYSNIISQQFRDNQFRMNDN